MGGSRVGKFLRRVLSPTQLTTLEKEAVVEKKKEEPQLSHRQISGSLRPGGLLDQPVQLLSDPETPGLGIRATLREAPWKVPRYEPFRSNQIWGEDWTILSIDHARYYLLTIIDCFSRYIVAWGDGQDRHAIEVQNLLPWPI